MAFVLIIAIGTGRAVDPSSRTSREDVMINATGCGRVNRLIATEAESMMEAAGNDRSSRVRTAFAVVMIGIETVNRCDERNCVTAAEDDAAADGTNRTRRVITAAVNESVAAVGIWRANRVITTAELVSVDAVGICRTILFKLINAVLLLVAATC